MSARDEGLLSPAVWGPALEKFGGVTHLTVQLYDLEGRVPWGPVNLTPLFQLFEEHGWDPGTFAECAHRCFAQPEATRPAVTVAHAHGLAVVGTSLVLGSEIVGAAVGGYALVDFSQTPALRRLARDAGVPFQRLWEIARRQPPVPQRRLILHGELLQVLGDALLRENERTRQYEEAADRLEVAAGAKDEFLAILSHELRTPLTPILMWARMLQLGGDPAQVQRGARVIQQNVLLQLRLIEDLLDVNRIALGKVVLDLEVHDLQDVLRSALETIAEDAQAKGVRLEVQTAESLPVEGDAGRLQQIFRNVLSNALKFTPAGGEIRVTAARVGGDAVILVQDTGEGVAPQFLPFVFDMFRQQEEGTRRRYPGMGVGLAVSKRLTELHHGTIAIANRGEGLGTEVTVRLPLAGRPADGVSSAGMDEPGSSFKGLSILIVEDMDATRETLTVLLEKLGAEVRSARDGREALEVLADMTPDLVLCDLRMPRMDGFDFVRELHRTPEHAGLPVIAMSGLASEADRRRTRAAGFVGHVAKPFSEGALVAAVDSAAPPRHELEVGADGTGSSSSQLHR